MFLQDAQLLIEYVFVLLLLPSLWDSNPAGEALDKYQLIST